MNVDDGDADRRAVQDAIKEIHAAGGRAVTLDEMRFFAVTPISMGRPQVAPTPPGKRGPKNRLDQYEMSAARWRGPVHRLLKLPAAGAAARAALGRPLAECVRAIAFELAKAGKPATAARIAELLPRQFADVDDSTLRRALKRNLK